MTEISMREGYAKALVELAEQNQKIVALDVDTAASTLSKFFAERHPDRFFNVGIAEPCMLDVAVGLALGGYIPFVNGFAALISLRALEQVRTNVCYAQTNVKIAASYAGLSDFKDGATHYAFTDLANMRALPNLTVIIPADATEAAAWVPIIAEHKGPVYLRISRAPALPVYQPGTRLKIGRGLVLREGSDVTLVATGAMTGRCLQAADQLDGQGVKARVLELHTLKPIDTDIILKAAEETGALVTAEEHSIIGGLGSAVAETLSEACPTPLARVGIPDHFCPTGRDLDKLMDACGLSINDIVKAANRSMRQKSRR
ncbi:MAG: transketolase family protein [Anaerolineaceae bacterium]|nr:transketolase family protein [Anaerolineaceae bacterium]MBN2676655.1 transketolase family protein [Anaerolineaceae bacterium]